MMIKLSKRLTVDLPAVFNEFSDPELPLLHSLHSAPTGVTPHRSHSLVHFSLQHLKELGVFLLVEKHLERLVLHIMSKEDFSAKVEGKVVLLFEELG
jgi:hypothetical protein